MTFDVDMLAALVTKAILNSASGDIFEYKLYNGTFFLKLYLNGIFIDLEKFIDNKK